MDAQDRSQLIGQLQAMERRALSAEKRIVELERDNAILNGAQERVQQECAKEREAWREASATCGVMREALGFALSDRELLPVTRDKFTDALAFRYEALRAPSAITPTTMEEIMKHSISVPAPPELSDGKGGFKKP